MMPKFFYTLLIAQARDNSRLPVSFYYPAMIFIRFLPVFFLLLFSGAGTKAEQLDSIRVNTLHSIDSLKNVLAKAGNRTQRCDLLHKIGLNYLTINPEIALLYLNLGYKLTDTSDHIMMVRYLNERGSAYQLLHDFQRALNLRFQALRITDAYQLEAQRADVLNNIAGTYMEIKQYELAEKIFNNVLALRLKNHQYQDLSLLYNNLGATAGMQGHSYKCIFYCQKAIEAHEKYSSRSGPHLPYINTGDAYMSLNQPEQARIFYTKALQTATNMEDMVDCYRAMGDLAMKENNPRQAIGYFLKAEKTADENNIKRMLSELYENLAAAYQQTGDLKQALAYKEKLIAMMDRTFDEKITRQMNEMQVKYEADKKDKQIETLNKDRQISRARVEKRNLLIAVLACVVIAGIMVSRNIVLKQRVRNKHLSAEKALIENDNMKLQKENVEARYEVLKSKTNPHFLFNSLSTLASVLGENPLLAMEFIERFSELYRSILRTESLSLVALKEEMKTVENYLYLQKVRFEDNLVLDIQTNPALNFYKVPPFSVQMVVENAIKHNVLSDSRKLVIRIRTENDSLVVENNLQKRYSEVASTGIGQENIKDRYKLITKRTPVFIKSESTYLVRLPLLKEDA